MATGQQQVAPRQQRSRAVSQWSPRTEMERIFQDFFRDFRDLASWNPQSVLALTSSFPTVEMAEEKDKYVVKVETPGLEKEDIRISITDNTLHLRGEVRQEESQEDRNYIFSERVYGTFSRDIPLPSAVNADQVRATVKNGVLSIELPKAKEAMSKEIKVESQK
ncbi:MAG: Hsp20/alpha crystallin family protein [Nitrospirae bacterium]|nr:Hsp20/alpha crystallin family protein [Candidatus Manganitrophaceae bacterium]